MLQAQDLELRRLRGELAEAPARVALAQADCAKAAAALANVNAALPREEALRRGQELDAAQARGKISRLNKQMESATSAAQITALEHEIAFCRQAIATLEDAELASMERTETLVGERAVAVATQEQTNAALGREQERAAAVVAANTPAIAGIEAERVALRASLAGTDAGEALLSAYDRIAKAKGTALAQALDHKCSACQMLVRPQRWNELTDRDPNAPTAETVFHCETCGRMLYYDPRRDAPVRWSAGERLAAAGGPTAR